MTYNRRTVNTKMVAIACTSLLGLSIVSCSDQDKSESPAPSPSSVIPSTPAVSSSSPDLSPQKSTPAQSSEIVTTPRQSAPAERSQDQQAPSTQAAPTQVAGTSVAAAPSSKKDDPTAPIAPPQAPASAAAPQSGAPGANPATAPTSAGNDVEEITALTQSMGNKNLTPRQYYTNMADNMCSAQLEQQGGRETLMAAGDQLPEQGSWSEVIPTVDAVNNVQVQGNTATADVSTTVLGQQHTNSMQYTKEDGRWKLCTLTS